MTHKYLSIGSEFNIEGGTELSGFVSRAKSVTGDARGSGNMVTVDELDNMFD